MSNNVRKNLIFTGLIILILLMASVIYINASSKRNNFKNKDNNAALNKDKKIFKESTNNLSAWAVYWDLNSDKEIKILNKQLKNICYFAANFNSNNELVMPEKLINYYNETKSYDYNKYITIVNDKINSDGTSLLKDTNLLKPLLSNLDSRSRHIEDIINLAVKYDFDGIEIDYEQIKNDMELWNDYTLFIDELYQKTEKKGLKLRVLLEPNIPLDKLSFHEGPTYVMMCYNLHGGFGEPGEKANPKFIKKLIEKMSKIPGKKEFAIATGGFNWASNGKTTALSEAEANSILKEYRAKVQRDGESQCLFFNYKDEDNIEHQVWYADKATLESWMKVITEKGYDISIWRLGGNLFE
ncbi:putative sporulation-specific glycosylase YdhD [Clostridium liquoris]|jgi:spore germination protein YaaH|uniref:Putative sporulation-specific glycosylase YdhD n=1 Tax=Clostridium liquoris TaxID=1289519 RepID=A0A2T0B714_9CLOT|nr:glycosyl hydrolase family 18 protein [Clostridium liquoris]PRR79689.1 putative sporulation-specific glycosylase YdhD [Clostridium liquoris]